MIYRIDVRPRARDASAVPSAGEALTAAAASSAAVDPLGEAVRQQIREFGADVGPITTSRIFLLDTDAPAPDVLRIATELLADLVVESAEVVERTSDNADPAGTC